jgi:hypothetical protein
MGRPLAPGPVAADRGTGPEARARPAARPDAQALARASRGWVLTVMTSRFEGPVVGFRAWRIHGRQLWPMRYSALRGWPTGDVQAVCESASMVSSRDHFAPAPAEICSCGLYAFYEIDALFEQLDDAQAWGAVLGWGRIELHQDGFRSEWQRPVAISAPTDMGKWIGAWLPEGAEAVLRRSCAHIASRYGVPLVEHEQLEAVACEHGVRLPVDLSPVVPLALMCHPRAWRDSREIDFSWRKLLAGVPHRASARAELASWAVDLAVTAVLTRHTENQHDHLRMLEIALIGLLAAVLSWAPKQGRMTREIALGSFRSCAAWYIGQALQHGPARWELHTPSTFTYGQVRAFTLDLVPPPSDVPAPAPRPQRPLTGNQVLRLMPQLAQSEPSAGYLTDCLWRRLHGQPTDACCPRSDRVPVELARELYRLGSRASAVIGRLLHDDQPDLRRQRTQLREIAADSNVAPFMQAHALERLAQGGSPEAVMGFLAHPLASADAAEDMLVNLGSEGVTAARELARGGSLTDAQLSACISALGNELTDAARKRLHQRPLVGEKFSDRLVALLSRERALLEPAEAEPAPTYRDASAGTQRHV